MVFANNPKGNRNSRLLRKYHLPSCMHRLYCKALDKGTFQRACSEQVLEHVNPQLPVTYANVMSLTLNHRDGPMML